MKITLLLLSLSLSISLLSQNLAPDFSLVDTDQVEHNLYADYLDQGKTVILLVGAVWSPFDPIILEKNVLQDFQSLFVPSGTAAVLYIEPNSASLEDLMGTGNNNATGYDYISGCNFPVISTDTSFHSMFQIEWFPSIRIICPDRNYYTEQLDSTLFYTMIDSPEYIAEKMNALCGTEFEVSSIEGQVYIDENIDCILDPTESTNTKNIKAIIEGPTGSYTRYSNDEGSFKIFVAEGDYSVNLCEPNDLWTVCNNPQDLTISSNDQIEELEFGLQVDLDCSRIEAEITAPLLRRCFTSEVFVDYCNTGTTIAEDAFVEVELDAFMIFENSNPAPTTINGNLLTYELGDVEVLSCDRIKIFVEIACDTILGLEQCYTVTYGPTENCNTKDEDSDTECQEIRGAYDPNDKRAFPLSGSDEYTILPNEEIKYQVRFQNTGTDTAFTVVIEDVLSPMLDVGTFRQGQSSHPCTITIDERQKAVFRFDNIMLPDSNVNLIGSNGFVNYYISQRSDLPNGTHITNEAAIYFDFNEPVWTNVTDHIVDDGITSVEDTKEIIRFYLSPNPAADQLKIELAAQDWQDGQVNILDFNGKILLSKNIDQTSLIMDVSDLDSGLYLIQVRDKHKNYATEKLTIIK